MPEVMGPYRGAEPSRHPCANILTRQVWLHKCVQVSDPCDWFWLVQLNKMFRLMQ